MAYNAIGGFPSQKLPFRKKNKAWRKKCVDFADDHSLMHYHLTRKSVFSMRINYDLLHGKVHMEDMKMLLNPYGIDASLGNRIQQQIGLLEWISNKMGEIAGIIKQREGQISQKHIEL